MQQDRKISLETLLKEYLPKEALLISVYENDLFSFVKQLFLKLIDHLKLDRDMFNIDSVANKSLDAFHSMCILIKTDEKWITHLDQIRIKQPYNLFKVFEKAHFEEYNINLWRDITDFAQNYQKTVDMCATKQFKCTNSQFPYYITLNMKHGAGKHEKEFETLEQYADKVCEVLNRGKVQVEHRKQVKTWSFVLGKHEAYVKLKNDRYIFSTMFERRIPKRK